MQPDYQTLYETSRRIDWRVDEIIGGGKQLDFSKPFLPESFARTAPLSFFAPSERLALNHIRAFGYLSMFELVETFILPFVTEQAAEETVDDPFRARALQQFASEEAKHIALFKTFRGEFQAGFGVECGFIGPADAIGHAVLAHAPLAVAIVVLGIEWMSQGHYLESVKDDQDLDPQFKSLLKHHWMEEAQHAKLDGLVLREMASKRSAEDIASALDEYFEIGAFIDAGLKQQTALDLNSFERAVGRTLPVDHRAAFFETQHQALRWTFLGSAMCNQNFLRAIEMLGAGARDRIENRATEFC